MVRSYCAGASCFTNLLRRICSANFVSPILPVGICVPNSLSRQSCSTKLFHQTLSTRVPMVVSPGSAIFVYCECRLQHRSGCVIRETQCWLTKFGKPSLVTQQFCLHTHTAPGRAHKYVDKPTLSVFGTRLACACSVDLAIVWWFCRVIP